ncbi:DNA polymerase III subunit delta [Halanaerobacter jeridensis]|uniref:DNA polymerase III subunit delta n=1 Tax=Halanaerobacter jeridensis TaxID=706427 RepID=A0A939BQE7_9FIRM|nr:DNA polymerase III subunit delta [Halanaerobacter jeridensis]MBM7556224.1 DNA polymerase-3 subunit delta [Halanaerobacter jeridensis]
MNYKQVLKADIKDLDSLYLIHGSDDYQIKKFEEKFIEKNCAGEFKDFNLDVLTEDDNSMAQLFNSVETLPFMSEKRVVIFHAYELLGAKTSMDEKMLDLISDLPESTVLLLVSHKNTDKRLKIYKEIKKHGEILEFQSLKYKKLDKWIKKQVQKENYKITNRAVKLLEEAFNNNLQRLKNEIEKIIIFADDTDLITKEIVEQVISKDWLVKENIMFDFVDEIGRNNTSQALNLLFDILGEGTTPKQIIGMIARQIRLMLQSKLLSKEGMTVDQIAGRLKQHPYPIEKCLKQSRNFSIESLEQALEKLLDADYNLVTANDDHLELELLVVELKETI